MVKIVNLYVFRFESAVVANSTKHLHGSCFVFKVPCSLLRLPLCATLHTSILCASAALLCPAFIHGARICPAFVAQPCRKKALASSTLGFLAAPVTPRLTVLTISSRIEAALSTKICHRKSRGTSTKPVPLSSRKSLTSLTLLTLRELICYPEPRPCCHCRHSRKGAQRSARWR